MNESKEIWKDVETYEGLYQVSSFGRIKSFISNRNLKLCTTDKGYKCVTLCRDRIKRRFRIHRLVGVAFIENRENKLFINHKNGDKSDNSVCNLEWATSKENNLHAVNTGLNKVRGADSALFKKQSSSGIPGVYWNKQLDKWRAQITSNRKNIHLGYFDNLGDAEKARKKAEEKYFITKDVEKLKFNERNLALSEYKAQPGVRHDGERLMLLEDKKNLIVGE